MKTEIASLLIGVCLLLSTEYAFAQQRENVDQPVGTYHIDEITVTAQPIIEGNDITRYGETVSVVSVRQIDDLNAQDLPSSLRRVPGVVISRYNIIGSYGGGDGGTVFVRGHGSGRPGGEISTMIDGVPRFNGFWTHPLMDLMSIDIADRIEVQKSTRPVMNGNMSFSSVNVHTKRLLKEGIKTNFNSSFGSYNTLVQRLEHGRKIGNFDYYLSGSHRESNGSRPNADGETESLYGRIGYNISDTWDFSLLLNKTKSWANDPQPIGTPPKPVTEHYPTDNKLYIGTISHNYKRLDSSVKLYMDDGYANWRQWDDEVDPPEQENGISDYNNYGIRIKETLTCCKGNEILVGLDYDSYGGSFVSNTTSTPGVKVEETLVNTAPYFMISQQFGEKIRLIPSLGMRYNVNNEFGNQIGYQGGLVLKHTDGTQLHVNFARSFNLPGVYTAIFYGQYWSFAYKGDEWKELEPEYLNHFEIGGSYVLNEKVAFDLTYFYDKVTDALRVVMPPPPPPSFQNIGEYISRGVEATVNVNPVKNLEVFVGGAYMSTVPGEVPNAPDYTISTGLSYTMLERVRLNCYAQFVDRQYVQGTRSPQVTAEIDEYMLFNLRLGYIAQYGDNLGEIFLGIENITDENYEYRPGYPMPGRTFTSGLNLKI